MTLGTRLTSAREKAGLSKTELAARAKVTLSAISQIESGLTKNIRLENFFRIVGALHCNAEWLATGTLPNDVSEDAASYSASNQEQVKELLSLFELLNDEAKLHVIQNAKMLSVGQNPKKKVSRPPLTTPADEESKTS